MHVDDYFGPFLRSLVEADDTTTNGVLTHTHTHTETSNFATACISVGLHRAVVMVSLLFSFLDLRTAMLWRRKELCT
jgi:hypothetical protein